MRKFTISFIILFICVTSSILYLFSLTNGYSDPFYLKLTSPKQNNLILGNSKTAQGIQPSVLEKELNVKFYNYSFSFYASPFGSTYLTSIKAKLDTAKRNNTFILTIDAWSICSLTKNPNDTINFRERKSFLHTIKNINKSPNYKYLFKNFDGNYYKILSKNSPAFLHNDGWLEVNLDSDPEKIERRTAFTMKGYNEKLKFYNYSRNRYTYLIKTIDYLNKYGKVYLVKLPIHPDLNEIEITLLPNFNNIIQTAIDKSSGYFDMESFNSKCSYTDGVHLNKESGRKVSAEIANWITNLK